MNSKEETHRVEVQGQIKKDLIREEGKVKIETNKVQREYDCKKNENRKWKTEDK